MTKWVYFFGAGKAEGDGTQRALLGGKGSGLAEMSRIGLPVPPGFTITTEVCTHFYGNKKSYPKVLDGQVKDAMLRVHPDVAKLLKSNQNKYLEELEEILRRPVLVRADPLLHHEKFDLA